MTPNQDGFLANVHPVDDPAYSDLTTEQILSAGTQLDTELLIVADKTALTTPEMPLLALPLFDGETTTTKVRRETRGRSTASSGS